LVFRKHEGGERLHTEFGICLLLENPLCLVPRAFINACEVHDCLCKLQDIQLKETSEIKSPEGFLNGEITLVGKFNLQFFNLPFGKDKILKRSLKLVNHKASAALLRLLLVASGSTLGSLS
jgi:hypothetical protein